MMRFYFFLITIFLFFISGFVYASTQEASIGFSLPGVPVNLAATVGDKSIELSWSEPLSNGGINITDYVIEYKLTSGGVWVVFPDGVSTITQTVVNNLSNDNSYTFRVSAVNDIGQGDPSSTISITPGSPAQVLIMSFSDLTVSDIKTLIRITNEGSTAYEYQYTWCVTDSDINLCGGGNDIFSATAAKLIQPQEDFDTILTSTVPIIGSYWFHLSVDFGSDSSQAFQSFVATNEASDGGGGGGGGASSDQVFLDMQTGICVGADFNHDSKVNSIDFSIMLAFWKTLFPFKNPCVDINGDLQVNSIDFSILLYQWGQKPILFKKL